MALRFFLRLWVLILLSFRFLPEGTQVHLLSRFFYLSDLFFFCFVFSCNDNFSMRFLTFTIRANFLVIF